MNHNEHQQRTLPPQAVVDLFEQYTVVTVTDGRWTDPAVWSTGAFPGVSDDIRISHKIAMDAIAVNVGKIMIDENGQLKWQTDINSVFATESIYVLADEGLIIGSRAEPFTGQATIKIKALPENQVVGGPQFEENARGIWCWGRPIMHGIARTPWCRLNQMVSDGNNSILLDRQLDWRQGETIVIARGGAAVINDVEFVRRLPTDDRELEQLGENEVRQIWAVNGNMLAVDAPLRFTHFGTAAEARQSSVGLLDRNITITSAEPAVGRGHFVFFNGAKLAHVRFNHLGMTGKKGKYPVHCHIPGELPEGWRELEGLVVTNSGFHGIVLHKSWGFRVKDCYVFNVMGFGYYIELTDDVRPENVDFFANNTFDHCAAGNMHGFVDQDSQNDSRGQATPVTAIGHDHASGFWLANPKQNLIDCEVWDAMNGVGKGYVDNYGTATRGGQDGPTQFSATIHHCFQGEYSAYTRKFHDRTQNLSCWGNAYGGNLYGFEARDEQYENCIYSYNGLASLFIGAQGRELDGMVFRNCRFIGYSVFGGVQLQSDPVLFSGAGVRFENCEFNCSPHDVFLESPDSMFLRFMKVRFVGCIFRAAAPIRMYGQGDISNPSWRQDCEIIFQGCQFPRASWLESFGNFRLAPYWLIAEQLPAGAYKTGNAIDVERSLAGNWIVPM